MTLPEAQRIAQTRANVSGITHHVLESSDGYFVAGAGMRNELWPDRPSVTECPPASFDRIAYGV